MSMYFYDETDDWPEYQVVREHIQQLEKQHLECRREMREAESALASDRANEDLMARVEELHEKVKAIEAKLDETTTLYR